MSGVYLLSVFALLSLLPRATANESSLICSHTRTRYPYLELRQYPNPTGDNIVASGALRFGDVLVLVTCKKLMVQRPRGMHLLECSSPWPRSITIDIMDVENSPPLPKGRYAMFNLEYSYYNLPCTQEDSSQQSLF